MAQGGFGPQHRHDGAGEELLEPGARWVPRWLLAAVLAIAAVVAAVGVVLHTGGDPSPPPAAQSGSGSAPRPAGSRSAATPTGGVLGVRGVPGIPIDTGHPGPVLDVGITGAAIWVLQPRWVSVRSLGGDQRDFFITGRPLAALDGAVGGAGFRGFVPDERAGLMWAVVDERDAGRVLEFSTGPVRLVSDFAVAPMTGAAALGGHLYLTSANRVLEAAGDRTTHLVAALAQPLSGIVAAPAQRRLFVVGDGDPAGLWGLLAPGGTRVRLHRYPDLDIAKAALAMVGGRIWAGGFDTGDGVLVQLNARTLRPQRRSPIGPSLEPGITVLTSGEAVLWVRTSADDGARLICVDGKTGESLQSWTVSGPVASSGGTIVVGPLSGAVSVRPGACPG
jgi:hypothetical protein